MNCIHQNRPSQLGGKVHCCCLMTVSVMTATRPYLLTPCLVIAMIVVRAVADPIAISISRYPTEPASLFLAMDHTNFRHDEFLTPVCKIGTAGVETDHHQRRCVL